MAENITYCYSATGNCLDMAKNIARALGDTEIVNMRSLPAKTDTSGAKRVGFVFSCNGGGLPLGVEESMRAVQIEPGTYTFGIVQYAGYMGAGLHMLNAIHPLDYWAGASHQSGCIWLMPHTLMFPPLSAATALSLRLRARVRGEQIDVEMPGGTLRLALRYDGDALRDILLTGPTAVVEEGTI